MAIFRYSHNDEWTENPIVDALMRDCDIVEVDVVYDKGQVWASHSKRPLRLLYRGTVSSMYLRHMKRFPEMAIYFDFKTNELDLARELGYQCMKYGVNNKIYVGGKYANAIFFMKRFEKTLNVSMFSDLCETNTVFSEDVFGKKRWWMR